MVGTRQVDFHIEQQFVERWSPRSFDGKPIADHDLFRLFEAARWAPSAFNVQPWRFLYALRDAPEWPTFLGALAPFNQTWVRQAGAIVVVLSDSLVTTPGGDSKPSISHSFDAGAAWGFLALQAYHMGLCTHAMTGVDFDAMRAALSVPEQYRIECAIAVGRIGDAASLPEGLRAREVPSGRRPVSEFSSAGPFPGA